MGNPFTSYNSAPDVISVTNESLRRNRAQHRHVHQPQHGIDQPTLRMRDLRPWLRISN